MTDSVKLRVPRRPTFGQSGVSLQQGVVVRPGIGQRVQLVHQGRGVGRQRVHVGRQVPGAHQPRVVQRQGLEQRRGGHG